MVSNWHPVVRGLLLAGGIAVAVAAYAAVDILLGGNSPSRMVPLIASFGCFGLLLGGVFAFDAESGFNGVERPLLRVATSGVAGLALALLWRWPLEWALLSVVIAAALGYFGMSWAKYVDF
jgi:hypothetical protein